MPPPGFRNPGWAVEDEGRGRIRAVGGAAERLPATPTEAGGEQRAGGCRQLPAIVGRGVEAGGDLVRRQLADGLTHAARGEIPGAPAVRRHARQQAGCDRNVTRRRESIGGVLHPVRHPEDFVDHQDRRRLIPPLPVRDECFGRPAIVLHRDPFAVTRRRVHILACPVLSANRGRAENSQQGGSSHPAFVHLEEAGVLRGAGCGKRAGPAPRGCGPATQTRQAPSAARKAVNSRWSGPSMRASGCHCTPSTKRRPGSSSASTTPSSGETAVTARPPAIFPAH